MKDIFKKDGVVLMLVSLLILTCLPQMLCAFIMFISNNFLTNFGITMINVLSCIITYLLFMLGLSKYLDSKNKYIDNLINGIPLVSGYLLILLLGFICNNFGLDNYLWFNIINLIINGIILTIPLFISIGIILNKKITINIKNIIKLIGICIFIYIIPEVISGVLVNFFSENIFVNSLLIGIIYSVITWIFILLSINFIIKEYKEKLVIKIPKLILIIIMSILFIVSFIISSIDDRNNVKTINNMISYSLASGDYAFDEMDIIASKEFYKEASNIKCAYEYAISDTINTSDCDGNLVRLFKILKDEKAIVKLKELVNNKEASNYDIEALVKLMQETNDSELGKMTRYLISQMYFKRSVVLPSDLTEKDIEKLKIDLPEYNNHLVVRKYIDIYVEWLKQGKINQSVISTATKIASENKDSLGLQAAAIKFYLEAPDNISGSSSVVNNFVNLTKDTMSKKTEEEIINYKTYVVLAYQACNANDQIVKFLEEYEPNAISADLGALLVKTYKNKYDYEKAYNEALKVLKKDKYNVESLGFLSIYTLQSDLDESLGYALDLAKIIEDKKENYLGADIALGLYRLYLLGNYNTPDSKFAPYINFYREMSDEQKKIITDNEILNTYLIGRNLNSSNINIIDDMIKKYDYVSYFYYYRGVYELNNKEFKKAVEDISKAIELGNRDPFFYSELGFAYEGTGELKKSLEAFEEASRVIDEYNLGGITYNYNSIHNYFNVYINNAKHALYESEGEH